MISRDIFTAENNLGCANRLHRIIKGKKNNIVRYELKEYKRRSSLVVSPVIFQTEDRAFELRTQDLASKFVLDH